MELPEPRKLGADLSNRAGHEFWLQEIQYGFKYGVLVCFHCQKCEAPKGFAVYQKEDIFRVHWTAWMNHCSDVNQLFWFLAPDELLAIETAVCSQCREVDL